MNCVEKRTTSEAEKIAEGSAIQLTRKAVRSHPDPVSQDQRPEALGSKIIRRLHVPEMTRVQGTVGGASEVLSLLRESPSRSLYWSAGQAPKEVVHSLAQWSLMKGCSVLG